MPRQLTQVQVLRLEQEYALISHRIKHEKLFYTSLHRLWKQDKERLDIIEDALGYQP